MSPSTDVEIYNIVKQRLFTSVDETAAKSAANDRQCGNQAQSIVAMSYEEANYWFALITNGRSNALKKLKVES